MFETRGIDHVLEDHRIIAINDMLQDGQVVFHNRALKQNRGGANSRLAGSKNKYNVGNNRRFAADKQFVDRMERIDAINERNRHHYDDVGGGLRRNGSENRFQSYS